MLPTHVGRWMRGAWRVVEAARQRFRIELAIGRRVSILPLERAAARTLLRVAQPQIPQFEARIHREDARFVLFDQLRIMNEFVEHIDYYRRICNLKRKKINLLEKSFLNFANG